jgi:soluble lytic murein transglycosylase-like protein
MDIVVHRKRREIGVPVEQKSSRHLWIIFYLSWFIASGICPPFSFADIYKFVDEEGVTHISNVPSDSRYKLWWKEATWEQRKAALKSPLFDNLINKAASKYHVESDLIRAVIKAESDFNHQALSRKGAAGLMQLMPETASRYDVNNRFDPWSNIEGGVRYLRYLLDIFKGDLELALAAYNAGEGAVAKYNNNVPPYRETQTYVQRVKNYLENYRSTIY